ncbi:MAG: tol-pal system protein YbgF [Dissulfurispiraceae bacterium]
MPFLRHIFRLNPLTRTRVVEISSPLNGMPWLVLIAFSLLMITGCASTQDTENLRKDVNVLRMESNNQKKEIGQVKDRVSELTKDMTSMNAVFESQSSLLKQSFDYSKELQTLRGQFDENKYFMDKTIKELLTERELQQARITRLENDLKELKTKMAMPSPENRANGETVESPKAPEEMKSEKGPAEVEGKADPQQLYNKAYTDFKGRRYVNARQEFERFIKDYPKHSLVPNSYFWIGESYYSEKKYEDAILSYETVLKKYHTDEKAKSAMLKQAYSFIELGDKKTGKVILEQLIEKYPRTAEAHLAEKKIAELTSKNKSKPQKNKQ